MKCAVYICPKPGCVKAYARKDFLEYYIQLCYSGNPLRCKICSKQCSSPSNLRKHEKTHDKGLFPCKECDQPLLHHSIRAEERFRRSKCYTVLLSQKSVRRTTFSRILK